jgi:hypothetical protein
VVVGIGQGHFSGAASASDARIWSIICLQRRYVMILEFIANSPYSYQDASRKVVLKFAHVCLGRCVVSTRECHPEHALFVENDECDVDWLVSVSAAAAADCS